MAKDNRPDLSGLEEFTVNAEQILKIGEAEDLEGRPRSLKPNLRIEVEVEDGEVFLAFRDKQANSSVIVALEQKQAARVAGMLCMGADGHDSKGHADGRLVP